MPQVDILLATWNGERYLPALLDSLLAQTHSEFRLLVSDDGSVDATRDVFARYRPRFGDRWVLLPQRAPGGGGLRNFEHLMHASLADGQSAWALFCDQDDVWLPHKIERTLAEMRRLEGNCGTHQPCLVHTDLKVVDQNLQTMAPSFVRYQRMDPWHVSPLWMLSMNQVTGCTAMVNRSLLAMALPIPPEVVVHDWWCAVLSGSGQRAYIDEATVLYRQHAINQIGAVSRSLPSRLRRFVRNVPGELRRAREAGCNSYRQALALEGRLRHLQQDASLVADYLKWRNLPLPQRLRRYRDYYPGSELDRCLRCVLWPTAQNIPPNKVEA